MPSFEDIAIKAHQKTYILRETARDAQAELEKQQDQALEKLEKEIPVQLRDLKRYVQRVEQLHTVLETGEIKTLLLLLSGSKKSRIFSTNFAIGFFRGAGAMLGVVLISALIILMILNSPYSDIVIHTLTQGF